MVRSRHFGDQDGGDTGQGARPETSYHTGYENEIGGLGCTLEGSADKSKGGTNHESIDTTNAVGKPAPNETTYNGAEIVLLMC